MCQNHYSTSPWCLAMSLSCSCNENFNKTWSRMPNKRKIWNLRQEKRKAKVCPAHQRNDFNNSFTSLFIIKGSRTTAPPPSPTPPKKTAPNPKTNPKPNPNPNRVTIFLGGNCLVAPIPKTNPDLDLNPNPNRGTIFLGGGEGGNCSDTIFKCWQENDITFKRYNTSNQNSS